MIDFQTKCDGCGVVITSANAGALFKEVHFISGPVARIGYRVDLCTICKERLYNALPALKRVGGVNG